MGIAVLGGSDIFDELQGSPSVSAGRNTIVVTRRFHIDNRSHDFVNVNLFLAECLPTEYTHPGRYPLTSLNLYADQVSVEPEEGSSSTCVSGVLHHDYYIGTVTYSPIQDTASEDPAPESEGDPDTGKAEFAEHTKTYAAEFLEMPHASLKWELRTGKVSPDIISGRIIPTIEHRISFPRTKYKAISDEVIASYVGHVNETDFPATNKVFPGVKAETLLFVGAETSLTADSDGTRKEPLMLVFREKRVAVPNLLTTLIYGWNHYLDPSTGVWDRLVHVVTNEPIHPRASSFAPLFRPAIG